VVLISPGVEVLIVNTRNHYVFETKGPTKDEMKDESVRHDLAFVVDNTEHLNGLNLKLKGNKKLTTQLYDDISASLQN